MQAKLNHVAVLVDNIEAVRDKNSFSEAALGVIEEFESEGTRELYIGPDMHMARLLLMQAIGPGPYQDAAKKRGQGLHHVALDVLQVDDYVKALSGSGWFLHPKSLEFYKRQRLVYLCRPGLPLLEIQEVKEFYDDENFIEELQLPFGEQRLLEALHCDSLKIGPDTQLSLEGQTLSLVQLVS